MIKDNPSMIWQYMNLPDQQHKFKEGAPLRYKTSWRNPVFWGYSSTLQFWKQITEICSQHLQRVIFAWYGLLFSTLALGWNILFLLRANTYWQTHFFRNESSVIVSVALTLRQYLILRHWITIMQKIPRHSLGTATTITIEISRQSIVSWKGQVPWNTLDEGLRHLVAMMMMMMMMMMMIMIMKMLLRILFSWTWCVYINIHMMSWWSWCCLMLLVSWSWCVHVICLMICLNVLNTKK